MTSAPMRVPPSLITCTLTPMRCGGRLGSEAGTSTSAAATGFKFVSDQDESGAQGMACGENLARFAAQQLIGGRAQEIFHRGTDHHGAAVAREQQQPVFQAAENLVQILAQGTEDFAHSAQLQSDLADFGAHLPEFIAALERLLIEFAS